MGWGRRPQTSRDSPRSASFSIARSWYAGRVLPSELERALSTGRVWTREELDALGADLTRRLLWAQYDGARVERVFRLEAEGPRGLAEEPVALDAGPIRLVHPGELDPIARAAWGDALAALSILQPIPQLARPVHALSEMDGAGDALVEFPRRQVHPDRVRRVLAGAGWEAGEPDERLRVAYFFKRFARADLVAVIRIEPGLSPSGAAPQTPVEAFFMARAPGGLTVVQAPRLPLREVPAAVVSEVLFELGGLEARDTQP